LVAVNRAVQPARETLVFAVVRGDRKLNETALLRHLGAQSLRPAADDEIRAVGAVPGYASPVGLDKVQVVVDSEIPLSPNLVSGANREGYHLKNVNFGRDYTAADVAEIAQAQSGDACPHCGGTLDLREGVIIGRALLSSPEFTRLRGVQYLSEQGQTQTPSIGLYSLNLTRILACLAEEHHDERGLALPGAAAPYHVHLVVLPGKNNTAAEEAARQVSSC
jgi:prolyl-tRNA synthetase